jgi:Gpi18-like mannosyltransferase
MKKLLILAIVLRLLVAAFLFHPDIKTYNFQSSFLKKGVFNIYTYLVENKKSLTLKDDFVYFPLTYFTVGGYQWIASPILGSGFNSWLADASSNSVVRNPNIFKYLVVLKLPYLVLDILIAFLLKKFFDDEEKGKKAFTLWLFNPFTIFLIYAFSNIDIYAVLLTVIAFLLLKRDKLLQASAVLGIAAGFKLYPVLFIPFLILKAKNVKEKILAGVIPMLIMGTIVLPFWSPAFVQSAFLSGLTTRIFSPGFSIGFNESAIVGLLAISALFFYGWVIDKKINVFNYWIILLLSIFSFSHFHIAWLLWVAPFMVILAIKKPSLSLPLFLLATLALIIPMLYEDRSMTISLFRVYSTWYDLIPTPFTILQKFYDPYSLQSIFHSILAGGSLIIGYKLLSKEDEK